MSKLLVFLLVLGVLSFFLQQFVEALFITTLIVFSFFFCLGMVFFFQGLSSNDTEQLIVGLAMAVFSASYILVSYLKTKGKREN